MAGKEQCGENQEAGWLWHKKERPMATAGYQTFFLLNLNSTKK
ncbi:hypothetical protein [Paenibacillus sp. OV219]|nr:hypothetical protein [Paenibacillus sp. OV219]